MTPQSSPTASVVICVYNGERFLRETLDSVLSQTMADFEVLALDDGSSDASLKVLESVRDPRLRIIRREHAGVVPTLNAGLETARGDFIAFLDQDDVWAPTKLEEHHRCFRSHPDLDLTFTWYRLVDTYSNKLGFRPQDQRGTFSYSSLLRDYVIGPTSTAALRRKVLSKTGLADPDFSAYYDVDLFLRTALLRPANVAAIPTALTFYRRHSAQMSKDWVLLRREWNRMIDKFRRLAPAETASVELQAATNMTRYFAYLAYESRDFRGALKLLNGTLSASPAIFLTDGRNWLAYCASLAGFTLPASVHRNIERLAGLSKATRSAEGTGNA